MRHQVRVGLAERVDLGVTAGPMFGADLKLNFLRTKRVDMAVDPGFEVGPALMLIGGEYTRNGPYIQGKLPLLLGFNLMKELSIYMHGGVAAATYEVHQWNCTSNCYERKALVMGVAGLGVQIRLADFVSLQPEASIISTIVPFREEAPNLFQFGLGVSFGAQPDYKDLD
jgi:hypothetical protein